MALAHTGDPDVAEDVAQAALVRAWTALDRCVDPERFGSWLRTIVRRTALNRHARAERRRRLREQFPLDVVFGSMSRRRDAGTADGLDRGGRLASALAELAERQREVLLLYDLEGRSHGEIAELMGITPATSRKHLSDARARIRARLEGAEQP